MRRWLGCVAGLAVGLVLVHRLGRGDLRTPPLGSIGEFRAWLDGRDGVVVAMALLRLVAVAAGWWLLVLTVLDGVGRAAHLRPLQLLSARLTPAALRELLGAGAGAGMASMAALGVLGPPPPVTAPAGPPAVSDSSVIMRQLPPEEPAPSSTTTTSTTTTSSTTTSSTTVPAPASTTSSTVPAPGGSEPAPVVIADAALPDPGTIVMRVLDDQLVSPTTPTPAPAPAVAAASPKPVPTDDSTWVVEPGESFWAIAAEHLGDQLGREPTDREITSYWITLIEANRANLPDPTNPDLLFAGQALTLP